jgi:hypothetical protein
LRPHSGRAAAHLDARCTPRNAAARPTQEPATHGRRGQAWGEIITLIQRNMPGRSGQANSELVLHSQSQHLCKTLVPRSAPAQFHHEMVSAEQIVFLGFGYHDQSMNVLFPKSQIPLKLRFFTQFLHGLSGWNCGPKFCRILD